MSSIASRFPRQSDKIRFSSTFDLLLIYFDALSLKGELFLLSFHSGLGYKLMGQRFHKFLTTTQDGGSLFHLQALNKVTEFLATVTGVEPECAPGELPLMIACATKALRNKPVCLAHDERRVSLLG